MSTPAATTWWVEVFLGEADGVAIAKARLHAHDHASLSATGATRLSRGDRDVPERGYELATARALSQLARDLLASSADDLRGIGGNAAFASRLQAAPPS